MGFRSLILDSGAFTVWSQGATIDLDEYLDFCVEYPGISYYVNLDVIPGVMNNKRTLTKSAIEEACKASWDNYRKMIKVLPKDKVIPVFHQNDRIYWLDKYLDFGVKYIGISPANDERTTGRMVWLKSLQKHLFDGAGRPTVKTHGFAVTAYSLIKYMKWYSVDSASWKMTPSWGSIYLPPTKGGNFIYDEQPFIIGVTPQIPKKVHQTHITTLTPIVKKSLYTFLESCGVKEGTSEYVTVDAKYKLDRDAGEIWMHKKKRIVMRPIIKGVTNSFEERAKVCAKVMMRANKAMKDTVSWIYLAGLPMPYPLEPMIPLRLLSWYYCARTPSMIEYIKLHISKLPGAKK